MALTVIALGIAAVALAGCIYLFIRLSATNAEAERVGWELIAAETAITNLQKQVEEQGKETVVLGLEGVRYDPERSTMKIDGNLVVKGSVAAGKSATKKNGLSRED